MKKAFLIPVFFALLAGSACSSPASLNQPPTQPTRSVEPSATLIVTTPDITHPVASPTAAAETNAEAETEAEAPAAQVQFNEPFDEPDDAWSAWKIVTSQATGHDPLVKSTLENGRLRVSIQDKETYAYQFLKTPAPGNVSISVTYEYRTLLSSGVALVCRADPGFTSWYEARLLGAEGKYNFYQYDQKLKKDEKNPYILLGSGVLTAKEFSFASVDTVSLTCSDRQLSLDLNKGARVITQTIPGDLKGELSGIGVMSYNLVPVNIDFKTFDLQNQ